MHGPTASIDLLEAMPDAPGPSQAAKPPASFSQHNHPEQATCSEDDEDADLHVPLMFVSQSRKTPARLDPADAVDSNTAITAAFSSHLADHISLSKQHPSYHPTPASELEPERAWRYDAMDDLGSQPAPAAE